MLKAIPALDMREAPRTWIPASAGMTPWVGKGQSNAPYDSHCTAGGTPRSDTLIGS